MCTGLIEKTGVLTGRETGAKAGRLTVKPDTPWTDLEEGESIAVNGACLTFEKESGGNLTFFVMKETLDRTNLGQLKNGPTPGVRNIKSFFNKSFIIKKIVDHTTTFFKQKIYKPATIQST